MDREGRKQNKKEIPGSGWSMHVYIFWRTSGFKWRTFVSSGFLRRTRPSFLRPQYLPEGVLRGEGFFTHYNASTKIGRGGCHTPSISFRHLPHLFPSPSSSLSVTFLISFRHLPPDSARIGYATQGALFDYAQLSTDAVGALRKA